MKILTATVSNFGSYKDLTVDFQNQGLALISGPTGAGKSTLCDIVPWILFGRTAKGGAVDEVRAWGSEGPTEGTIILETKGHMLTVFRSRNPNDLYYITAVPDAGRHTRGKDLNDTQKLINDLLGMDLDLYLASAYFHEFSQTAGFFTANAKARRVLTEQLVDLSLAVKVTDGASEYRKGLKAESNQNQLELEKLKAQLFQLDKSFEADKQRAKAWEVKQTQKIQQLSLKVADFGIESRNRYLQMTNGYTDAIRDLEAGIAEKGHYTTALSKLDAELGACSNETCPTCGNTKGDPNRMILMKKRHKLEMEQSTNSLHLNRIRSYEQQLEAHLKTLPAGDNPYVEQLEMAELETNPYTESTLHAECAMVALEDLMAESERNRIKVGQELSDVELLLEIVAEFRIKLVMGTISNLESLTNKLLHDYFDAEIRVRFSAEEADKLEVEITKDGHISTFTQLSKGQRQLLKLTFGVAVMQVAANHKGVSFNAIFLDEFADGLDENMKAKAFRLLEYLSTLHESVFAIDHSESLKSMFTNKWEISLVNGESQIEQT